MKLFKTKATLKKSYLSILCAFGILLLALIWLGIGQEFGDATEKEVTEFLTYDLSAYKIELIAKKNIAPDQISLSQLNYLRHISKRFLMSLGLAISQNSEAVEFTLRKGNGELARCVIRVHGDRVLAISLRDTKDQQLSVILNSRFPNYVIE